MIASENHSKRVVYAELLRIFGAFAVVVIHVSSDPWVIYDVRSLNWQISNLYDSMARWAVPVFVMLTGMFLLDPSKQLTAKKIYRKYIPKIILAIIVWGLIYRCTNLTISKYIGHEDISRNTVIVNLMEIVFGTAWYHLWYLYLLVGLYAMLPIYRVFTRHAKKKDKSYLLLAFTLLGISLPFLKRLCSSINPRMNLNLNVPELATYSGYLFMGYYLSRIDLTKKHKMFIYAAGILSLIITVVGTKQLSIRNGEKTQLLYENLYPTVLLEAVAVFVLVKSLNLNWMNEKQKRLVSETGSCTFGIYLSHPLVIRIFSLLGITTSFTSPSLSIPLLSLAVFITSFLLVLAFRTIVRALKYLSDSIPR